MPSYKIEYRFESFVALNHQEIVDLLNYLESIDLYPLKYGESPHRPNCFYNPEKKIEVAELCYKEGRIAVKGKNFLINFSVCDSYAKPYMQSFEIKITRKFNPQKLVEIGLKLCELFKACYCFSDYNFNSGSGTPGRSIKDCLFGFSWLNVLGKPYIEMWGLEKIMEAPVSVSEYNEFVVILLSESPFIEREEVREKSKELKNYFGFKYFYNKAFENQKTSFDSMQELIDYNEMLDKKADYLAPDFHRYYNFITNHKKLYAVQKGISDIDVDTNLIKNVGIVIEKI